MEDTVRAINDAIVKNDHAAIVSIFNLQWNRLGTGEQRSVASHFIQQAVDNESFLQGSLPHLLDTYVTVLNHLPATVDNAADTKLRRILFQFLVESSQDYSTAARILAGTRIQETGVYEMNNADAADLYISVAECFLQEDEIAEADSSVNKAGSYVKNDAPIGILLRYKTASARVLDANRKFSSAARFYHELSQHPSIDEQLQLFARAAICAILDTSPQRYKVLALLAADARLEILADELPEYSVHAEMVRSMHRLQIVTSQQTQTVEATLAEHQLAKTNAHNLTILQRSVVQHNMMAVSQLYDSIRLDQLQHILSVKSVKLAEQITAEMIQDKGMVATIDAVDDIVDFVDTSDPQQTDDVLWCRQLNATVNAIQSELRQDAA